MTKGDPGDLSRRPYRLAGHVMYRSFQALTNAATSDDGGRHPVDGLLWMMTTVEARALLPTFQTAMLYAVADTIELNASLTIRSWNGTGRVAAAAPWPARLVGQETDGWWVVPSSTPTL